jgi:hypothetical protein
VRYYLDCEFNGMGGELLSLALVREDKRALYIVNDRPADEFDPWVRDNVVPLLYDTPSKADRLACTIPNMAGHIQEFLRGDTDVTIITDWPDDIKYFCELIITGPGKMINVRPSIKFEMHHIDAYPTTLPDAIQHNAYWDAMALRHKLTGEPSQLSPAQEAHVRKGWPL